MQPIPNSIAAMAPELAEWRRDLHQHPELAFEEHRTAGIVAEKLRAFGLDAVETGIGGPGVVGVLHGRGGPAGVAAARPSCCAPTWTRCRCPRRPACPTPR